MLVLTFIFFLFQLSLPDGNQFGGGITGAVIALVLYLGGQFALKKWDARAAKEQRLDDGDLARQLQEIKFEELNVKQQEVLWTQTTQLIKELRTDLDSERALRKQEVESERKLRKEEVEAERKLRQTVEERMKSTIREMEQHSKQNEVSAQSARILLNQTEQQFRMFCDNLNIAFWAITPDGHLEGNITFFETLTGLESEACHNDGWFQAIEEGSRAKTKHRWQMFLQNYATRPVFTFEFQNVRTGAKIKTKVFCVPMTSDGQTIYKFTAQTAPLQLSDA